ncbi:MAG: SDR family NAD(P)-dependent oxidoreductase [Ferruginibacter sp.]|nr:SDR family NAD(P)-dependent oxidoreductase [Cytophagales bacterium]
MDSKIWFITGISSGLGKALAEAAVENGDFVIGTFRNPVQVEAFNEQYQNKAFALSMDVTQADEIQRAFRTVQEKFGRIDVLVNNAGFGFAGAVEEASVEEIRAVFEANFFGTLQTTQAILPIFRRQKSGHLVQISSHGGIKAVPGFGIYNASKFALEGFSEALAAEIAPLGIKLTIVEPGPFRTNFAGDSFRQAQRKIDDYHATAGVFRERIKQVDGKQEGDPAKAARAIIQVVGSANPPLRLPLGKIAIATIQSKLESVQKDLDDYRELAAKAVFGNE